MIILSLHFDGSKLHRETIFDDLNLNKSHQFSKNMCTIIVVLDIIKIKGTNYAFTSKT